jgi:hypothetical protein
LDDFFRPPIYRVPRFTGPFPFPSRGPVNRGFTVLVHVLVHVPVHVLVHVPGRASWILPHLDELSGKVGLQSDEKNFRYPSLILVISKRKIEKNCQSTFVLYFVFVVSLKEEENEHRNLMKTWINQPPNLSIILTV